MQGLRDREYFEELAESFSRVPGAECTVHRSRDTDCIFEYVDEHGGVFRALFMHTITISQLRWRKADEDGSFPRKWQ